MKHYLTLLTLLALAAAALFYEQVLSLFAGMTALESLEIIVQFLLHVAVATILGSLAMALPKLIHPWVRMLQQKRRALRRGRVVAQAQVPGMKPRKLSALELLQMLAPNQKIQKATSQGNEDRVDLKF